MIQTLTAPTLLPTAFSTSILKRLVLFGAKRVLNWEPEGSVLFELPDGQQIRFGHKGSQHPEPFIRLKNYSVLWNAMRRGSIGFAESYIDSDVYVDDLVGLFTFFLRNRNKLVGSGGALLDVRFLDRIGHHLRENSRAGSRKNISEHYDLGNSFYELWLDPEMNYSSGYYQKGASTLEDAQADKIDLILSMAEISQQDHILEIGCGWGAFARRAAKQFNAQVKGITLSHEQQAYFERRANEEGVDNLISAHLQDYRDTKGRFDKIVSIEMIEAVGEKYWQNYFNILHDRLTDTGVAVIQAITIKPEFFETYKQHPDFIQRYIFPGGMLPTAEHMEKHAQTAGLKLDKIEQFGVCYAETLKHWRNKFEAAWPKIEAIGFDESFRRKWRYYLTYCEAGFRENMIDVGLYRFRKC